MNAAPGAVAFLAVGWIFLIGVHGMVRIGTAPAAHRTDAPAVTAFVLVMAGILVTSATVPFHFWLPDAHAVAPTPVCMLMSGVMVELGVYGIARVYLTVFAGPGGIPASAFTHTLAVAGALTALTGAVMCRHQRHQRHLKRLLAFSTIGHTGLWLLGLSLLDPQATTGTALYVAGHAGVKAALFGLTGVLLDRHGSVDEHGLYGRGRGSPLAGALFLCGGLALAGLPPFGTALGKAVAEHAAGERVAWLPALYVLVSALTGGAVLRAGLRIFHGAGPAPARSHSDMETSGDAEEPEVRDPLRALPLTMTAVPAVLLAAAPAVGVVPGVGPAFAAAARTFDDRTGYVADVQGLPAPALLRALPKAAWTPAGVLLGLLSAALAVGLAAAAVWRPDRRWAAARTVRAVAAAGDRHLVLPLRRLHSGLLGDYVAWLTVGLAALLIAVGAQR